MMRRHRAWSWVVGCLVGFAWPDTWSLWLMLVVAFGVGVLLDNPGEER